MTKFFESINYSCLNEDGNSEILALKGNEENRILCITGSGARPLDLLITEPKEIVSIDFNPTQNYLLELKLSAVKNLDYEEFIKFIGLKNSDDREKVYLQLRDSLGKKAQTFWSENINLINEGILYSGRWEKFLKYMSKFRYFKLKSVKKLFEFDNVEKQYSFWKNEWEGLLWNFHLRICAIRPMWKYVFKEPGIELIHPEFPISSYIRDRFDNIAKNMLFKESPFLWMVFFGHLNQCSKMPPHLMPENYQLLKRNIDKIKIITESLDNYLSFENTGKFDGFSLSDFSSYAPPEIYDSIWQKVFQKANPNAKICERQFLVKRKIPGKLNFTRDHEIESILTQKDSSFIYTFTVGKIG